MRKSSKILVTLLLVIMASVCIFACSPMKYTVKFDLGGGTATIADQRVEKGAKASRPTEIPTKEGVIFDNWYDGSGENAALFDFGKMIEKNTTVYAKYREAAQFSVSFVTGEGASSIEEIQVAEGGYVTRPTDPVREGFKFTGWFSDEGMTVAFDFENTKITGNITLYAGWTSQSQVLINAISRLFEGNFSARGDVSVTEGGDNFGFDGVEVRFAGEDKTELYVSFNIDGARTEYLLTDGYLLMTEYPTENMETPETPEEEENPENPEEGGAEQFRFFGNNADGSVLSRNNVERNVRNRTTKNNADNIAVTKNNNRINDAAAKHSTNGTGKGSVSMIRRSMGFGGTTRFEEPDNNTDDESREPVRRAIRLVPYGEDSMLDISSIFAMLREQKIEESAVSKFVVTSEGANTVYSFETDLAENFNKIGADESLKSIYNAVFGRIEGMPDFEMLAIMNAKELSLNLKITLDADDNIGSIDFDANIDIEVGDSEPLAFADNYADNNAHISNYARNNAYPEGDTSMIHPIGKGEHGHRARNLRFDISNTDLSKADNISRMSNVSDGPYDLNANPRLSRAVTQSPYFRNQPRIKDDVFNNAANSGVNNNAGVISARNNASASNDTNVVSARNSDAVARNNMINSSNNESVNNARNNASTVFTDIDARNNARNNEAIGYDDIQTRNVRRAPHIRAFGGYPQAVPPTARGINNRADYTDYSATNNDSIDRNYARENVNSNNNIIRNYADDNARNYGRTGFAQGNRAGAGDATFLPAVEENEGSDPQNLDLRLSLNLTFSDIGTTTIDYDKTAEHSLSHIGFVVKSTDGFMAEYNLWGNDYDLSPAAEDINIKWHADNNEDEIEGESFFARRTSRLFEGEGDENERMDESEAKQLVADALKFEGGSLTISAADLSEIKSAGIKSVSYGAEDGDVWVYVRFDFYGKAAETDKGGETEQFRTLEYVNEGANRSTNRTEQNNINSPDNRNDNTDSRDTSRTEQKDIESRNVRRAMARRARRGINPIPDYDPETAIISHR